MIIREESPGDHLGVHQVNCEAFETDAEAHLVDAVRLVARPFFSFVAVESDEIVGHILFTPVSVGALPSGSRFMGLAPMAVAPSFQNRGIGSALVRSGLEECRSIGTELVFVLGHPGYYPRFGFVPAATQGVRFRDESYDPYLFVLELKEGALDGVSGELRYHPAFDGA